MKLSNREFAKENKLFQKACEIASISSTSRQASKFRHHKGIAYKNQGKAQSTIDKERQKTKGIRI